MNPGEILIDADAPAIDANVGRREILLYVRHVGDRPIQVGSHYHFFEVNRSLVFDRGAAYGMRLNVPAGTAVRFEPGDEKEVRLTQFAGRRAVFGGAGLIQGPLDDAETQSNALEALNSPRPR